MLATSLKFTARFRVSD